MKPTYQIWLDGKNITEAWTPYVRSISVSDKADKKTADSCVIVLGDPDAELELPDAGRQLEVYLGYDGDDVPTSKRVQSVGKFIVDTVAAAGPPTTITLNGKSAAFAGSTELNLSYIQNKKNRTHPTTTIGDLYKKVAGEHGLKGEVDPAFASINLGTVQQTNETDTNLLQRIAIQYGGTYKIADNRLMMVKPGNSTSGGAAPTFTLKKSEVSSWMKGTSKAPEYKSCIANYHDLAQGTPVEVTAGSGEPVMRLRNPFADQATAQAAAQAFVDTARKAGITFAARMPGRPDLFAGGRISPTEFPYGIGGDWELTEVNHTLSGSGLTTEISSRPL